MDTVNSIGIVEIIILENTATIKDMVTEKCTGEMEVSTRVTGSKECSMALEKSLLLMAESKKVNSKTINL